MFNNTNKDNKSMDKTDAARAAEKRCKRKLIAEKRFYCAEHDYAFNCVTSLNKHLASRMHHHEKYIRYHCELCNYHTKIKCFLARHQRSKKHQRNIILG
jgi:hypothetical protein